MGDAQVSKPEPPSSIRFGRDICGDLVQAERREWWLANGLGAYAAGTVAGTLTRRYPGLLIAPVDPPLGRRLVFAKADATLIEGDRETPLHSNRWGSGVIDPVGHLHLESFELQGRMPVWRYVVSRWTLEARVWMQPGEHTTYLAYRLLGAAGEEEWPKLRVRLLVNARDHHATTAVGEFSPQIERGPTRLDVVFQNRFTVHFLAQGGDIRDGVHWIENFDLPIERERGLPNRDNHLCVGEALLDLRPGEWVGTVASLHDKPSRYLEEAMRRMQAADRSLLTEAAVHNPSIGSGPDWVRQLVLAADNFLFRRPIDSKLGGESIIAGYPWFGDWGRDTMIALPGLTLACGRFASARNILETFARFVDRGMLPNVFPGNGEAPEYNTADAALWYVEAWRAYLDAIDDRDALARVFPVLEAIIDAYRNGTRYGIGLDESDGLMRAGEPGVQLTWMDAKIGDWVVTPRMGKPVEINALWYNALRAMFDLAALLGHDGRRFDALAEKARAGFRRFVRPDGLGLYDVLDTPEGDDATIRPNQIFAVSLTHSPLDSVDQALIVAVVGNRLLSSYGLRSLDPAHRDYRAHYAGGVWERDGSYHQGPAWAWLLGHYALAEYRVSGDAQQALDRPTPIRDHLFDAGVGTVSEILDGDEPHTPRGCPAQAWSVACTLEAWVRLERIANQPRRALAQAA